MSVASANFTQGNDRKRKRLTFACNACRSRKVKCDDVQPICTNCSKAGLECITTDPRQPGQRVQRREAQLPELESSAISVTMDTSSNHSRQGQIQPLTQLDEAPTRDFSVVLSTNPTSFHEISRPPTPTSAARAPLPILPRFFSGNSLQVLTQWIDLAFLRIGVPLQLSGRHNIDPLRRKSSSTSTLLAQSQTRSLSMVDTDAVSACYNLSINLIYPLFDSAVVVDILRSLNTGLTQGNHVEASSSSAVAHLIIAIVSCQDNGNENEKAFAHLQSAYAMLGILVAEASLRSTQALFLMALVLRGFNQAEVAWHVMSVASSISQTLGMHRCITDRRRTKIGEALAEEYVRSWWAIYALDKLLSLELEKPSSIQDAECNQSEPLLQQSPPIFEGIIGLAKVQSRISERCVQGRSSEEKMTMTYKEIIREKIQSQGELDQMLLEWEAGLANEIRPSNYLYCDRSLLHYVSFLAIQFYQTLVLLHRNTLLVNIQNARKEIEQYCAGQPYIYRLRNGQAICGNATRSIVNVLSNVHEQSSDSILYTLNAPLIATYALAIYTLKHPASRLVKSDLELLVQAILFVKQQRSLGKPHVTDMEDLLSTLQSQVSAVVAEASSNGSAQTTTPSTSSSNPSLLSNLRSEDQNNAPVLLNQPYRSTEPLNRSELIQNPAGHHLSEPLVYSTLNNEQSALMEFPDLFGSPSMFLGGFMDTANIDWDALTVAFDLPSYER